jgi:hypothetical protein
MRGESREERHDKQIRQSHVSPDSRSFAVGQRCMRRTRTRRRKRKDRFGATLFGDDEVLCILIS